MHHILLHLAPDPREPFFYQDCLQVDNHNIEETLKEFNLHNLSLSNHQPQKTQKQHHRNITHFTQQTIKVPTIKRERKQTKQMEKCSRKGNAQNPVWNKYLRKCFCFSPEKFYVVQLRVSLNYYRSGISILCNVNTAVQ
jgi:hypothetical protein